MAKVKWSSGRSMTVDEIRLEREQQEKAEALSYDQRVLSALADREKKLADDPMPDVEE